ncbi:MAG: aminotransferase class V-fold PLP-dependent enzyme [Flavobacteriales bacterium]|nr:aminotransferase class V-fold PLP-dependent enzyme [Flavobacteriales bacterium]
MIPFNIPYQNPNLQKDMHAALSDPRIFRNQGFYHQEARNKLAQILNVNNSNLFLTPSCTHALEIITHIIDIEPGDEIILPSYTYVSTANAFFLKGATLVFADVLAYHPSLNIADVEKKITSRTKAIVLVHYGGIGIDVIEFRKLADRYNILFIEDAAHTLGATYKNKPLGTYGDFATISFHETKNLGCVQGGALLVNNPKYIEKANTVTQCGTNRLDFMNKKTVRYNWVSQGTNGILAEPLCAILSSQLTHLEDVTKKRKNLWQTYFHAFRDIVNHQNLFCIDSEESNGHIFYLLFKNADERILFMKFMTDHQIEVTTHYQALHHSPFYLKHHSDISLIETSKFHNTLIRLPLYHALGDCEQSKIIETAIRFFK